MRPDECEPSGARCSFVCELSLRFLAFARLIGGENDGRKEFDV
jgi:hypothetical protein